MFFRQTDGIWGWETERLGVDISNGKRYNNYNSSFSSVVIPVQSEHCKLLSLKEVTQAEREGFITKVIISNEFVL